MDYSCYGVSELIERIHELELEIKKRDNLNSTLSELLTSSNPQIVRLAKGIYKEITS